MSVLAVLTNKATSFKVAAVQRPQVYSQECGLRDMSTMIPHFNFSSIALLYLYTTWFEGRMLLEIAARSLAARERTGKGDKPRCGKVCANETELEE